MKKLIFLLLLTIVFMLVLLAGALFYIDLTGHKGFSFEIRVNDETVGTMRLEKYITENKIVYKARTKRYDSLRYSQLTEDVFIDKTTRDIVHLDKEEIGSLGGKVLVAFFRENGKNDYVYLDHPKFVSVSGVYLNRASAFYIPGDPILCLTILEKYNFWRKGKQYFDVAVAAEGPVAPILDKLEVQYVKDEYIQIMGNKIQAEIYTIKSPIIPDVKVALSTFYHELLFIEDMAVNERIELVSIVESLFTRIKSQLRIFTNQFRVKEVVSAPSTEDKNMFLSDNGRSTQGAEAKIEREEIFINDGTSVISGNILSTKRRGEQEPIIMIVADDGPVSSGEKLMIEALSRHLAETGFAVVSLQSVRDLARETSFYLLDDETKKKTMGLFLDHLYGADHNNYGPLIYVGFKGGGFVSLNFQDKYRKTAGCVQVGNPGFILDKMDERSIDEFVKYIFKTSFIELSKNKHIDDVRNYTSDYLEEILKSEQDVLSFKRFNLPLKEYREYLERDYLQAVQKFNAPILFLYTKEQKKYFNANISGIKKEISNIDNSSHAYEVRNANKYFSEIVTVNGVKCYELKDDFLKQLDEWLEAILARFKQYNVESVEETEALLKTVTEEVI